MIELYQYLLHKLLEPALGAKEVGRIDSRAIRNWELDPVSQARPATPQIRVSS